MVSAAAAPRPEATPPNHPFLIVRETHRTFTGPTGAEIANPATAPRRSSSNIFIRGTSGTYYAVNGGHRGSRCAWFRSDGDRSQLWWCAKRPWHGKCVDLSHGVPYGPGSVSAF